MSKSGHHKPHWLNPPSFDYMNDLDNTKRKKCPKKSCKGVMVEVWSRYKINGPINIEQEFCECGKIFKDSRFAFKKDNKSWKPRSK